MPLSKAKKAAYNKAYWEKKHPRGTALMPKALARHLQRLGVSAGRYARGIPVSLDDYRALERELTAKVARVEWQSSGIRMLMEELMILRAKLAMLPAMQDTQVLQRLTQVEAEVALQSAVLNPEVIPEGSGVPFKDLRRFLELHARSEREGLRHGD